MEDSELDLTPDGESSSDSCSIVRRRIQQKRMRAKMDSESDEWYGFG